MPFFYRIANLKYSNPKDKMVCVSIDGGYTFKYFSSNQYGSISNAKKASREWLKEKQKTKAK